MSPSTQIMWRWTGFWMCLKAPMKMERYDFSLSSIHFNLSQSICLSKQHRLPLIKALSRYFAAVKMSVRPPPENLEKCENPLLDNIVLMCVPAACNSVPGEVVLLALWGQHVGVKCWHRPREDWGVRESDGAWAGAEARGKSWHFSSPLYFLFGVLSKWGERATFLRLHGNH